MATTKPRISFEYFPPKTDAGREKLLAETTPALNALSPEFFSVTYGAGGSTRDNTLGIVSAIADSGVKAAPHLSFGGDDESAISSLLDTYRERGISRLVALRGAGRIRADFDSWPPGMLPAGCDAVDGGLLEIGIRQPIQGNRLL